MEIAPTLARAGAARLDGKALRTLIARRLAELDHPEDLLEPDAADALIAHANGSPRRLRAGLSACLFLASTEDASRIDAGLVSRALHTDQPPQAASPPKPVATVPPPKRRVTHSRLILLLSMSGLAVSLGLMIMRPSPHIEASHPAPSPVAPAITPKLALKPQPPPAPLAAPAPLSPPPVKPPAPPVALAPLPPPIAVRAPPVPPADQPASPPATQAAAMPAAATTAAILLLYPARDPGALERLRPIALHLQQAGLTDIRARPTHAPPSRRAISFFYSDDRALADVIAKTLAAANWPHLAGNLLQPSLVLLPPGLPPRNPGTVEVQLP